jgi:hypothetical protein
LPKSSKPRLAPIYGTADNNDNDPSGDTAPQPNLRHVRHMCDTAHPSIKHARVTTRHKAKTYPSGSVTDL